MKPSHRDHSASEGNPDSPNGPDSRIAVLPLGATEYHGRHLPPETDWIIADAIAARLKRQLPQSMHVTFLPVEKIGYSVEHMDHPSTRTLGYHEAVERWIEIGASQARQGIRKLVLLNAHGGNSPLLTVVATELRIRYAMLCVATAWTRFALPPDTIAEREADYGIHGGDIETSIMLALAPDRVNMQHSGRFASYQEKLAKEYRFLRAYGKHAFGWKMTDLGKHGTVGDSSAASAEKGEAILQSVKSQLVQLMIEVDHFDLHHFQSPTS